MTAKIVYAGEQVKIPSEMGAPRQDQLLGTPLEQLTELAGRVCYDSLGAGRSSGDYHRHIRDVGHLSVYEHANVAYRVHHGYNRQQFLLAAINRPGTWVFEHGETSSVIGVNFRSVMEWNQYGIPGGNWLGAAIYMDLHRTNPLAFPDVPEWAAIELYGQIPRLVIREWDVSTENQWVSVFMAGSRGFSHEQVRHGDFSAISQRSTRFVDESGSRWLTHPLINKYLQSLRGDQPEEAIGLCSLMDGAVDAGRDAYVAIAKRLESYLLNCGVEKTTARKQARGAARGYLGNALETELIFSAPVHQWRRMLQQRASRGADAEIAAIYHEVALEFHRSGLPGLGDFPIPTENEFGGFEI